MRHDAHGTRGSYFIELFAGTGGVAKALRKLGFLCYEYEIAHGPQYDLTVKKVVLSILRMVRSGAVRGVVLGPPCAPFSIARCRTGPIRSKDQAWGFDRSKLSDKDWKKVEAGNACLRT